MKRIKLFLENFLAYGFINIINKFIPFLLLPVITRLLNDPSDFGVYDMYNTIIGFASPLILLGMYDAMFREYFEKENIQYRYNVTATANRIVLVTSIVASILLALFSSSFSTLFFGTSQYSFVVILAAVEMFLSNNRTIIAGPTRIQNKRKIYVFSGLFSGLSYYLFAIFLINLGYSFFGMIYAHILSTFLVLLFFLRLNKTYFTKGRFDKKIAKELFSIGLPLVPTFMIYWVYNSMDKLIITNMLGTGELGIYSIGSKMSSVSSLIYAAFSGGFSYFKFSTMKDDDQVEFNSKLFEYLGLISYLSFIFIYPFIPMVFDILFPSSYGGGELVVPYLFLSPLLLMLFQVVGSQFIVIKKTYLTTITLALGAVVNVALNWLLIPIMGIEGAALATLLGYCLSVIVVNLIGQYYQVHKISMKSIGVSGIIAIYWLIARLVIHGEIWKQILLSIIFISALLFVYREVLQQGLEIVNKRMKKSNKEAIEDAKKIIKLVKNPRLIKNIPLKIKLVFDMKRLKLKATLANITLTLGKNVQTTQKVILSGEGSITIGDHVIFGSKKGGYFKNGSCEIQPRYKDAQIVIGNKVSVNNNLFILSANRIEIGTETLIGEGVMIMDYNAHGIHPTKRRTSIGNIQSVKIGQNCWIGSRATILPGTTIGNHSIVGAGAVVKGEYPENVILAGNPAQIIKTLTSVNEE